MCSKMQIIQNIAHITLLNHVYSFMNCLPRNPYSSLFEHLLVTLKECKLFKTITDMIMLRSCCNDICQFWFLPIYNKALYINTKCWLKICFYSSFLCFFCLHGHLLDQLPTPTWTNVDIWHITYLLHLVHVDIEWPLVHLGH